MATADYQFQGSLASSAGTAPSLTNLMTNAVTNNTFTTAFVGGASRTVLRFPQNNGVALSPTTGVIANDSYTIAVLISFDTISGFRRVLDFKNGTSDLGLYVRDGSLIYYNAASGSARPILPNTFYQVVITRDAAKNVTAYVNGVQQLSFVDSSDMAVIDANNTLRFFQDNSVGAIIGTGKASAGFVARALLFNVALTAQEVAQLSL